ncbi:transcriptional regulator, LysR family [Shimia gijangensis]|uniref:Transcriptional regulator, LysR family n=1 Tax=Shimia gijangensis TaxID=1470563 RepID=A0A1M6IHC2_9RHOB|nr:LysR family transcriptional regulator [Shimia gijangensis]SHJ33867.1 transcriptional regulator, LysR family [Shimia gijangensis]
MQTPSFDQLPLEWIRAFEAAARLGSFTAAAGETGLTQSAISQRIGHLEARLGTRLFLRQARQITLTPEGEAWLPHVQLSLEGLRDSTEALFGVARNRITLSASSSITELWLVPRLARLAAETGADIRLRTMVVTSGEAKDDSIRIRYGAGDWSETHRIPLYDERLSPVATPQLLSTGNWQDLPRLSVSGPRPDWRQWSEQFGTSTTPVPYLRFDTFSSALAAARAGLGVLLASLPLVEADLTSGTLKGASTNVLTHHETYWLLAAKERVSRRQWQQLVACLSDT